MSTADWREVYELDVRGPRYLPRLSSRVIERAAERQERNARQAAGVVELEHYHLRRARKALGLVATILFLAVSLAAQVQRPPGPVTLAWDASASQGIASYWVLQSSTPSNYQGGGTQVRNVLSWTTLPLPTGTYYFVVVAADANGNRSPYSNEITVTVVEQPAPLAISGITSLNISDTSAEIRWLTDRPSSTRVDYGTTAALGTSTGTDPALVTQHSRQLAGLQSSTLYYFQVSSTDAGGLSASSSSTFMTASPLPPLTLSPLSITQPRFGRATIYWTSSVPATSAVEYGQTDPPNLVTTTDPALVLAHEVTISIHRKRTYYVRAVSQSATGTTARGAVYSFYSR